MVAQVLTTPVIASVQFDSRKLMEELTNGAVLQMRSLTEESKNSYTTAEESRTRTGGMDCLPEETYNALVEHCIRSGKLRDAMFLICAVNWGTRFSDTVRVRFCHIFNRDGEFLDKFTLPNGEKKTNKQNIYYNNRATKAIIKMYLAANPQITPSDYMFTSNSGNSPRVSLKEVEQSERYGTRISALEKIIRSTDTRITNLMEMYADMVITKEEFLQAKENLQNKKATAQSEISVLQEEVRSSVGVISDNDHAVMVKKPISSTAAQNIIIGNLSEIGIFPQNRIDKNKSVSTEEKYNTHSLRKTFSETFYRTGVKLREAGIINIDNDIMKLLQEKFMHSNISITGCYNKTMAKAFEVICCNMDIGMDAICKAMEIK